MAVVFCNAFEIGHRNCVDNNLFVWFYWQFYCTVCGSGIYLYPVTSLRHLFAKPGDRHRWPAIDISGFIGGIDLEYFQTGFNTRVAINIFWMSSMLT